MTQRIAFSTLACPDWSLEEVLERGAGWGYEGVELRLIDGKVVELPVPAGERARVARALRDSGLAVVGLGSSIRLADGDPETLAPALRAFLELAVEWSAPMVRVYGGRVDPAVPRQETLSRIAAAVEAALPDAARLGVTIALETHDDFSSSAAVAELLALLPDPAFAAIWDVMHTARMGETPSAAWSRLGARTVDVHIKDAARSTDGSWRQVPLGQGDARVRDCLAQLVEGGYAGWVTAEWEKAWHRELEEPEVALPQHLSQIRDMVAAIR